MTRRYREAIELLATQTDPRVPDEPVPHAFRWRGAVHTVTNVLGHWREDARWWSARGVQIPQRDLWRIEVTAARAPHRTVCEVACENGRWRLDRVWD